MLSFLSNVLSFFTPDLSTIKSKPTAYCPKGEKGRYRTDPRMKSLLVCSDSQACIFKPVVK